jgi:3-oxoacyl-[acyl-carrier-protein] synthase-1
MTGAAPLILSHYTATTCLGPGLAPLVTALRLGESGLAPCRFESVDLTTHVGEIAGVDAVRMPAPLAAFDCRNNRLALLAMREDGFEEALRAAIARVGSRRFGLFLGTSTTGILETEIAYRHRDPASGALPASLHYRGSHSTFSVAAFLREYLRLDGPVSVVSTACSSSAKVFGLAARMIAAGAIDAALVGGIDSLCLTTLYGFHSLQLLATAPCRPFAADRAGLSIGEGAAYAVLEGAESAGAANPVALLGWGESSDAYHLSAPHPDGAGAQLAMQAALGRAGLASRRIDYVNLHGTATASNDAAESRAVVAALGASVPCSSTKGATGHTLGAAGAVEAVVCAVALRDGFIPGGIAAGPIDPALGVNYVTSTRQQALRHVMSNSFGFGGSNCALVFGYPA